MALIPLPTPFFRGTGSQFAAVSDSGGTSILTGLSPLTPNYSTNKWVAGTLANVDDAQLDPVATVIEQLIQQDLEGTAYENTTKTVDAVGTSPVIPVVMAVSGDTEVSITVGAQGAWSIEKAASFAALVRSIPGHGVQWVPPAP